MQVPTEFVVVGSRRRHGGFSTTLIPGSLEPSPLFYIAAAGIPVVRPGVYEQIARPRFINSIDVGCQIVPDHRPSD